MLSFNCQLTQRYYRAQGILAGEKRDFLVDSGAAAVRLQNTPPGSVAIPSMEELSLLVKQYSPDYATIRLLQAIYSDSFQAKYQKKYFDLVKQLRTKAPTKRDLTKLEKYQILFVPGLAYRLDKSTGADFSRQRNWFGKSGITSSLIETDELGLAKDNAIRIKEYIALHSDGRKVIIVSASKGSQDVLEYFAIASPEEIKHVHAWVNIGGINRGTLLANEFCKFPKSLLPIIMLGFRGRSAALVRDLQRLEPSDGFLAQRVPKTLKVIHFQGILFDSQVNEEIHSRYRKLSQFGPNDGLTLTVDSIVPKGIVITEIGLDHYFRDPEIDTKTAALALLAVGD
ncbi:hypothetical protein [Leptospira broomii]|uniref:hypothetical protein n=1 Tax=Leptospira broomii TaxID=301541 RepID=UPI000289D547|nr:hypothetical protein [Leptospira broomii]